MHHRRISRGTLSMIAFEIFTGLILGISVENFDVVDMPYILHTIMDCRLQRNKYNTLLRQALARLETPINYDEHCVINTILEYGR